MLTPLQAFQKLQQQKLLLASFYAEDKLNPIENKAEYWKAINAVNRASLAMIQNAKSLSRFDKKQDWENAIEHVKTGIKDDYEYLIRRVINNELMIEAAEAFELYTKSLLID